MGDIYRRDEKVKYSRVTSFADDTRISQDTVDNEDIPVLKLQEELVAI